MSDTVVLGPSAGMNPETGKLRIMEDRTAFTTEPDPQARPGLTSVDDTIRLGETIIMRCGNKERRGIIEGRIIELIGATNITISLNLTQSLEVELTVEYIKNGKTNVVVIRSESAITGDPSIDPGAMMSWADNLAKGCSGKIDENSFAKIKKFRQSLSAKGVDFGRLSARMSNPGLGINDRICFVKYLNALASGNTREMATVKNLITNRIIFLNSDPLVKYTGKESQALSTKSKQAILLVAEASGVLSLKDLDHIDKLSYERFVSVSDMALLVKYRKTQSKIVLNQILARIGKYSAMYSGSVWGTPLRADITRRYKALFFVAPLYGVPVKDIQNAHSLDNSRLIYLKEYSGFRGKCFAGIAALDTMNLQEEFLSKFRQLSSDLSKEIYCKKPDVDRLINFSILLKDYEWIAIEFGLTHKEISDIESSGGLFKDLTGPVAANKATIYTMKDLPEWLKPFFGIKLVTGQTVIEFLNSNVKYLVIGTMPDLKSASAMTGGYRGLSSGGGTIFISSDKYGNIKDMSTQLLMFMTIMHEACHCAWANGALANNQIIQKQQLSAEGTAYHFGASAVESAMKEMNITIIPAEVQQELESNRMYYTAASEIMGSHDLKNAVVPEGLDAAVYPSNTPHYRAYELALSFRKSEKNYMLLVPVFEKLILGEMKLEDLKGEDAWRMRKLLAISDPQWAKLDYVSAVKQFKRSVRDFMNGENIGRPLFEMD